MRFLSFKSILFLLLLGLAVSCSKAPPHAAGDVDYYTCTMHPSVHSRDPGKCPICSMDLVPVMKNTAALPAKTNGAEIGQFAVPIERQQQIGVTYATVTNRLLERTIPAVGRVEATAPSGVIVSAELFEPDIASLHPGQKSEITTAGSPGRVFVGKIQTIDPTVNPETQTQRIHLAVENPDLLLRPGLDVDVEVKADPVTGLAIPVEAVKPTGLRNLVFVDQGGGKLEPRFVSLGGRFGDFYLVQKGLNAGERVVSSANFLIDAESKIQGAVKDFAPDSAAAKGAQ